MEGTTSKSDIIKPIILKAGVPLAVSIAGFVYAWIIAKKTISKVSSSSPNDTNSSTKSEESFRSVTSTEHVYANVVAESSEIQDTPCLEQEIACLRSNFEGTKMRESPLRFRFDQYCITKEQESMLGHMNNMLSLVTAHVEFLDKEISCMQTENRKLENFLVQHLRNIEQLDYWKSHNRMLHKKFKKLLKKSKAQSHLAKKQALKIKAKEAEILRSHDVLQVKNDVIDKLEDEIKELKRVLDQLQYEKNELLKKLDIAEESYKSKIEEGGVSRDKYNQVIDELEQMKKEKAEEVRENIELEYGGSDGVMHYDSEHELHSDSHHHRKSAFSKRTKLLRKLKKWVEGNEKEKVRNYVS
ncbi:unnamed protein product [Lupinus luteus]|uniref:Uncharacterized protein n=1 Tax=Lupinus luteus TaxID=3873 RepID=A0AAV1WMC5_LUPLU